MPCEDETDCETCRWADECVNVGQFGNDCLQYNEISSPGSGSAALAGLGPILKG